VRPSRSITASLRANGSRKCAKDSQLVVARLDRAIQYSRGSGGWPERPRRTGSPACAGDDSECAVFALPFPNTVWPSRGMVCPRFAGTVCPSMKEGAGNAGCALHPRSRVQNCAKKRTRAYRFSGNTPASPAQWPYDLCRALPGDEFVLSPSLPA
jgi:hypothetical protein